ncbi:MAG: c-type cytochrome [bacterium]
MSIVTLRWGIYFAVAVGCVVGFSILTGCRGVPSEKPPIHIVQDMDHQPRLNPQSSHSFFRNGRGLRTPPLGTVARGHLYNDPVYYQGINSQDGKPVHQSPQPVTMESLRRGKERYEIFCAVCHGRTGYGESIVAKRGLNPPPVSLHSEIVRNYSDGYLFQVISNGVRSMPGYATQIPFQDRWHIVNYLRALQKSQAVRKDELSIETIAQLGIKE